MPPRNPSELARLEEELADLFEQIKDGTKFYPKARKEEILRQIRQIEEQLGMKSVPYNSSEFGQ